ncbi:MAG: hypothetical protein AAF447_19070 [Myxococcota bacterium]
MRGVREGLVVLAFGALAGCGDVTAEGPEGITLPASEQRVAVAPPSARVADGALLPRTPELAIQAPREVDPGDVVWLLLTDETGRLAEVDARWRQTRGPAVDVQDANGAAAWFTAPATEGTVELAFAVGADFGDGLTGGGEVSFVLHHDTPSIDGGGSWGSGGGGLGTGGGGAPEPEPEPAPAPDFVLFWGDKDLDQRAELYRVGFDGSEPVRLNGPLAPGWDVASSFRLSPDGRHVVFRTGTTGSVLDRLFIARTDGSALEEVVLPGTSLSGIPDEPWAPDSSRVAVTSRDGRLFTVRANGTGVLQVSEGPVENGFVSSFSVRWSPTGRHLAYIADHNVDDVNELFLARPNRRLVRRLSGPMPRGGDVVRLAWSPRGDRVAYWADQSTDGLFQVFAATVTGNLFTLSPLQSGPGFSTLLSWAPDGSRLLYRARVLGAANELFTVRGDGAENTRVATADMTSSLGFAEWTGDSAFILYLRTSTMRRQVLVTGPEGQGTRVVYDAPSSSILGTPVLSNDGQRFALERQFAGSETLFIIAIADGATTTLPPAENYATLRWHPDDTHLMYAARFTTTTPVEFELVSYRLADGANPIIGDHTVSGLDYAFTSEGDRIVYLNEPTDPSAPVRLYLTTPDADAAVLDLSGFLTPGGNVRVFGLP